MGFFSSIGKAVGGLFSSQDEDPYTASLRSNYQRELDALKENPYPTFHSGIQQNGNNLSLNENYQAKDRYASDTFDQLQSSLNQEYRPSKSVLNQYLSDYDRSQAGQQQGVQRSLQSSGRGLRDNIRSRLSDQYSQQNQLGRQGIRKDFGRASDQDAFTYNKEADVGLSGLPQQALAANYTQQANADRLLNELRSRYDYKVGAYEEGIKRNTGQNLSSAVY